MSQLNRPYLPFINLGALEEREEKMVRALKIEGDNRNVNMLACILICWNCISSKTRMGIAMFSLVLDAAWQRGWSSWGSGQETLGTEWGVVWRPRPGSAAAPMALGKSLLWASAPYLFRKPVGLD